MKSTCESLKVFDFNEEDELSEMTSARFMSKFKNPNALDKYQFLQNFAQGTKIRTKEIGNVPCVDVDAVDNDRIGNYDVSYTPLDAGVDCATKGMSELDDFPQNNSTSSEQNPIFIPNKLQQGSLGTRDANPELASPEKDESVDVIPDSDESLNGSSPSSSSNNVEDGASLDEPSSEHCFAGCEMGERNMTVSICPDYIVYHGNYCTESRLIFSSSCITLKGSGNQGMFSFQWGIDDIIDIESRWFGSLEMTMVKIRIIPKDTVQAASVFGTSGIEELKFCVVDSNWYEKQEEITSLDVRYSVLWTVVFDADIGRFGDASDISSQKSYFPNFDEPFEEVVYPKGDPDAVSIGKRDVDLLQPEMFVNDTIIDFYIKYLKNNMEPEGRQRFHFFNSFFFRKLIDLDKDPKSAFEGRAAFQRVRKWTRKVNLFEKDYVFIPVNFNYHWSLIVICHPGEVAKFEDEDVHKSLKLPCILHMDSIRGSHTGLKDLVQSYLWEEWQEKQKEISEDISSKFFNLRYVPLELPQQQNSYDCGLFLLHYVELFLEEAPVNFNPFKITKFSNFLNVDWFLPPEASLKRGLIQRLICGLLDNHPREISQASGGEKHFTSNCPDSINNNETGIEIISERYSPKRNDGNSLCSQADQGVEITLLPTSSMRSSQCATDSALVFREYFEPGVTAGSFLDGQYQSFNQSASFNKFKSDISPIEEDIEASGHFIYPPAAEYGVQRVAEITSAACGSSYSSRDFGGEISWNPEISVHQTGHEDSDSSPETSVCASDDSLEVEVDDNNYNISPLGEDLDVGENLDQKRSESPENTEYLTQGFAYAGEIMDVPDSQEPEPMLDGDGDTDLLTGCKNSVPGLTHQDGDVQENEDGLCDDVRRLIGDDSDSEADVQENGDGSFDDVRLIGDDSVSEADVQENGDGSCDDYRLISDDSVSEADVRAAKRLRLMPPTEEGKLT